MNRLANNRLEALLKSLNVAPESKNIKEKPVITSYFVIDKNKSKMDIDDNLIPEDHEYAIYSTVYMKDNHRNSLKNAYKEKPLLTMTQQQYYALGKIYSWLSTKEESFVSHKERYVLVDMLYEAQCSLCEEIVRKDDIKETLCPSCYKSEHLDNDITRYLNNVQQVYEFDETYSIKDAKLIPKYEKGIYVFTNIKTEIVYIGKATDLRSRVNAHVSGVTNTKDVHHDFSNVTLLYLESSVYDSAIDFIEKDIIQIFNPKYNKSLNKNLKLKVIS